MDQWGMDNDQNNEQNNPMNVGVNSNTDKSKRDSTAAAAASTTMSLVFGIVAIVRGIVMIAKKKEILKGVLHLVFGTISVALVVGLAIFYFSIWSDDPPTDSKTEKILSTDSKTEKIPSENLSVTLGDGEYQDGMLEITAENEGAEAASFYIVIEATDSDGYYIGTDTVHTGKLAPGQKKKFRVFTDHDHRLYSAKFRVIETYVLIR